MTQLIMYDNLKRVKEANYSNGDYYHYTYDAVGNRKTQTTKIGATISTVTYNYDHANRLIDVAPGIYCKTAMGVKLCCENLP
jgi:YD repeat-containing protein